MVIRKWIQVMFLGWQEVQWLPFQKLALYFSLSPPGERGWPLFAFLLLHTKKGPALEGRKRNCLHGKESHLTPEWSFLLRMALLNPLGETFGCSDSSKELIVL